MSAESDEASRRRPSVGVATAGHTRAGWLFTLPMILVLGIFLVVPIVMALYVSMTRWSGNGGPFDVGTVRGVGLDNYRQLLLGEGLVGRDFMTSVGNTVWYVLLVVPLQTVAALVLALLLHRFGRAQRHHSGRAGVLRTMFYLPSVTSAVSVTTIFVFLFAGAGPVNAALALLGVDGPNWTNEPRGLVHLGLSGLGIDEPAWGHTVLLGRTAWDWLSGPSVAMLVLVLMAVWTTSGTFMLIYLAALADLPVELDEAAALDGATGWRKLWWVTVPQLRSATTLVVLLGTIGTWQMFDQVYATGGGAPGKTLLTPAYLSYTTSFQSGRYGLGSAIAFVVFVVIVALTWVQRRIASRRWGER